MHMFVGCIKKGISLKGYYENKLVRTDLLKQRHDNLADEMVYRGMKHRTPVSETDIFENQKCGEIDLEANNNELISRCPKCKERIISIKKIVRNL